MGAVLNNPWAMPVVILVINVVYVSFNTIRMIMMMKGRRYLAGGLGMGEMLVYVIGLGLVLKNLDNVFNVAGYAIGFGLGIMAGMKIEEKLALGYITLDVITSNFDQDLPTLLRDKGYGVTSWIAYGREGARQRLEILTPRKWEMKLYNTIRELDPNAFLISHEPKTFHGGFWVKAIRRKKKSKSTA